MDALQIPAGSRMGFAIVDISVRFPPGAPITTHTSYGAVVCSAIKLRRIDGWRKIAAGVSRHLSSAAA
ncbi:MAG TPA: hypothetical protein VIV65_11670 [Gemmatimonadaceae bacterium]|jgi:hypothetical protein